MPIYKVKIKWQKELFNDIELNDDESPIVFKAQLFALTGVQTNRQKILIKGKVIGDDNWGNVVLNDGMMLMLMGTAEEIPPEPEEKPKFVEDMTEHEVKTVYEIPTGLSNLGNTCYLNSLLQCLRTFPELKEAIKNFTLSSSNLPTPIITIALRDLFAKMDRNTIVAPVVFLHVFHLAFPRFAEKGENGNLVQQDVVECWASLMKALQQELGPVKGSDVESEESKFNFIEQYFKGSFKVTLKNTESEEEKETHSIETFLELSFFVSQDVKYLQSGLKSILEETVTKFSNELKKNCLYLKKSKLNRLPSYLTIQILRFEYKEKKSSLAKILKEIKFTIKLDVFELCTEELQTKLMPMRAKFKEEDDRKVALASSIVDSGDLKKDESKKKVFKYPTHFKDDAGSNNSGFYELKALITHKGREVSCGHFVAWIHHKKDDWFKCDDEKITNVTTDEILKLAGGGDWHSAYLLFYGSKVLETETEPEDLMEFASSSN